MIKKIRLNTVFGELTDIEAKYAPDWIFYTGNLDLLAKGRKVAVVGSRKVSDAGIRRTRVLAKTLADRRITLVSGLDEGIDAFANQAAIEYGGKTIAVLGTPLSKFYPKSDARLLEIIKKGHLAISQFPENHPNQKRNFLMQNHTMALISDATVIVEASENSDTKDQGWEALRLGRTVFILQSVAEDKSLTWSNEMIGYGAQVLNNRNMNDAFPDLPSLTDCKDITF